MTIHPPEPRIDNLISLKHPAGQEWALGNVDKLVFAALFST